MNNVCTPNWKQLGKGTSVHGGAVAESRGKEESGQRAKDVFEPSTQQTTRPFCSFYRLETSLRGLGTNGL